MDDDKFEIQNENAEVEDETTLDQTSNTVADEPTLQEIKAEDDLRDEHENNDEDSYYSDDSVAQRIAQNRAQDDGDNRTTSNSVEEREKGIDYVRNRKNSSVNDDDDDDDATEGAVESGSVAASLNRIQQDLLHKEQQRNYTGATKPGAVAVPRPNGGGLNSSTSASLNQMEQDIVAKEQESNDNNIALQPGAVTVPGFCADGRDSSTSATLNQTDQDIAAKDLASRSANRTSQPGAVAMPGLDNCGKGAPASLNQTEQDAKDQGSNHANRAAQPGAVTVPGPDARSNDPSESLSQMEQDIIAKDRGSRFGNTTSQPGAVAVPGPDAGGRGSSLNQMEQDIVAKDQGSRNTDATSQPGAIAVPGPNADIKGPSPSTASLNQMERDIVAKDRGSENRDRSAQPGAVAVNDSNTCDQVASASLNQIEQDIVAKDQNRNRSSQVVAVSGTKGSRDVESDAASSLAQLEQDMFAKKQSPSTSRVARGAGTNLNDFEQDIVGNAGLNELERDILAKDFEPNTGAEYPGAVATANRSVPVEHSHSSAVLPADLSDQQRSHLRNLEDDVVAKGFAHIGPRESNRNEVASGSSLAGLEGSLAFASMRDVENDLVAKPGTTSLSAVDLETSDQIEDDDLSDASDLRDFDAADLAPSNANREAPASVEDITMEAPFPIAPAHDPEMAIEPDSSPALPTADVQALDPGRMANGDGGNETGVQAFVTDTVVDATGVAVVMPEEEEEKLEQQRFTRLLILGFFCFMIVLVAVAVPVALALKKDDGEGGVEAPLTESPLISPSIAPTSLELLDAKQFLLSGGHSDPYTLENMGSPQYLAAEWLTVDDNQYDFRNPEDQQRWLQRYRLATMYFALDGDKWFECGRNSKGQNCIGISWLSSEDECTWWRCACNDESYINRVDFGVVNSGISGSLPDEFFQLTNLTYIAFTKAEMRGTISQLFSSLTDLRVLKLDDNAVTGNLPADFLQNSTSLSQLGISGNQLKGSIPSSIFHPGLVKLELQNNNLNGTLPSQIGSSQKLSMLELGSNRLSGEIPEEVFGLQSLTHLGLSACYFNGTLQDVSRLTELKKLDLQINMFRGPVPTGLGELTKLRTLSLDRNELTGTLPEKICSRVVSDRLDLTLDCEAVTCACCNASYVTCIGS